MRPATLIPAGDDFGFTWVVTPDSSLPAILLTLEVVPISLVYLWFWRRAEDRKNNDIDGKASLAGFTKRSKLKKRISASKTVKNGQKSSFLAISAG